MTSGVVKDSKAKILEAFQQILAERQTVSPRSPPRKKKLSDRAPLPPTITKPNNAKLSENFRKQLRPKKKIGQNESGFCQGTKRS
ncbi:hypothetical protein H6F90_24410 [Trichocoleus sp. FACHB-591]|uniref:hypothetical protein n=1 Tax=Trichocoleus sp. FACHB-591 TaxID=2692872 RepID=UPI0016866BC8|nr:hypothetical protein [Trichocoleus sp. FACHB-591]MBD2098216.1 hypothetical protein [Trichocoleus sp. FACHB-591]